jgi:hypothetical protein
MATQTNELDVWENEVPVVIVGKDGEFDIWDNEVPLEDVGESEPVRRRTVIF